MNWQKGIDIYINVHLFLSGCLSILRLFIFDLVGIGLFGIPSMVFPPNHHPRTALFSLMGELGYSCWRHDQWSFFAMCIHHNSIRRLQWYCLSPDIPACSSFPAFFAFPFLFSFYSKCISDITSNPPHPNQIIPFLSLKYTFYIV